jgi:hypothetical protein
MFNKKLIIIIIAIAVIGFGAAATIYVIKNHLLWGANQLTLQSNTNFNKIDNLTGLPVFSKIPGDDNGWRNQTPEPGSAKGTIISFINNTSCTLDMASQAGPYVQTKLSAYDLSKSFASTVASIENGTISDDHTVRIKSSLGETDFFVGTYHPIIRLTHPTDTTPTKIGGITKLDDSYTTFLAVRSIANPLPSSASLSSVITTDKSIVSVKDTNVVVVIKYSCKSIDFKQGDVLSMLSSVEIDFSAANAYKPELTTTGK